MSTNTAVEISLTKGVDVEHMFLKVIMKDET